MSRWRGELPAGRTRGDLDKGGELRVESDLTHEGLTVVVGIDVERVEGCEVERGSVLIGHRPVQHVSLGQHGQGHREVVPQVVMVRLRALDQTLSVSQLGSDRLLPRPKILHRQSIGKISVEQLLLLPLQLHEPPPLRRQQPPISSLAASKLVFEHRLNLLAELRQEPQPRPDILHPRFHRLSRHVRQAAVIAPRVPTQAEEVVVGRTSPTRRAEAQSLPAAAAEQRALEEVAALPRPIASQPPIPQDRLAREEQPIVDQRLVPAVVLNPAVHQPARVVDVRQHPVHRRPAERRADELGRRTALEPAALKLFGQLANRHLPRGVDLERPPDVLGTVLIHLDRSNLDTILPTDLIRVAQRGVPRRPTAAGLLVQTLLGLNRQVLGVELSDRRHDPVQQSPGRRVVNRLRRRHQLRSSPMDLKADGYIVLSRAGEPINLVNDDVLDPAPLQTRKEIVQSRPIR